MTRRDTGFPLEVRELIRQRANETCERCGELHSDMQAHHRRPRGAGGSRKKDTNTASNGLWLCGACHRFVESYRSVAFEKGWLVRQSQSPLATPVMYRGQLSLLCNEGFVYRIPAGAA